ncbi:ThiF family adenylyltransferase [Solibacillus sp. A46]|uniref:ThiF family adenylyltransferase n=1 Tax=Solibacillus faecavium TaxID=2762221 RepID=A0ABR8XVW0_9BACL|nr:ThiF family adenylyltransferase [Solibacillus faecavium]MBD8036085.1 ThiF family adenylyltransferase [Solibacillus faecavium]
MNNRYARQSLFLGENTQQRIQQAKVLIIGAGALGSASSEMLARAGIGHLTIVDRDYVEWSNLQRQQLYVETDVHRKLPKAIAAKQRLEQINSEIIVEGIVEDVHGLNIETLMQGHMIVVDATDNFDTSLIINDAANKKGIPYIFGACVGSYGLTLPIVPGETPCLHCLLQHLPMDTMTCDTVGVISPIVQVTAAYQVTHIMKWLSGIPLQPIVQSVDLWKDEHAKVHVSKLKNPHCLTCGEQPIYPFLQLEQQMKVGVLCGRDAVQLRPGQSYKYSLEQIAENISKQVTKLIVNPYLLSCHFETYRIVFFEDGRAIIHGVADPMLARVVYNRFIQIGGSNQRVQV